MNTQNPIADLVINHLLDNPILDIPDSYKHSHVFQYPFKRGFVSSYIEARSNKQFHQTTFFGLQMFRKRYLSARITMAMIDEAEQIVLAHGLPFFREGWELIVTRYGGYMPLRIQAVKEGSVIPVGHVLVQVVNTDEDFFWLTSLVETGLLRGVWYPTTVATLSWHIKWDILKALIKSSDDPYGQILFKLHDFAARGVSSLESANIGGTAHLVNFRGTDTLSCLRYARLYYGSEMAGFSIPASEHATMTAWKKNNESQAYRNMIKVFREKGNKLIAIVSDSYDIYHAVTQIYGIELKSEIESFGADGGCVVLRPDSGNPLEVLLFMLKALKKAFGGHVNSKGFFVLNPAVRIIQGDGVNRKSINAILAMMLENGFSIDNITFGMGGALLQAVGRDDLGFAMKESAAMGEDGVWYDVFKEPVTDPGKHSKRGRLALIHHDGGYQTIHEDNLRGRENLLVDVWLNGQDLVNHDYEEVRALADLALAA